jgi:hypothetical protein
MTCFLIRYHRMDQEKEWETLLDTIPASHEMHKLHSVPQ